MSSSVGKTGGGQKTSQTKPTVPPKKTGPTIGNPVIKGKYSAKARATPTAKKYSALLERRPTEETGKKTLAGAKKLAQGAIPAPPTLKNALLRPMLSMPPAKLKELCQAATKGDKNADKLKTQLDSVQKQLKEGSDFDSLPAADKKKCLAKLEKELDAAIKTIGKNDSPEAKKLLAALKEQSFAVKNLQKGLAMSPGENLSLAELRKRGLENHPAFEKTGKALDKYWKAQEKCTPANFATLSMNEKSKVVADMQKALTELNGSIDESLTKFADDPEATMMLHSMKEAGAIQAQSLAGLAQDEMKAHANLHARLTGMRAAVAGLSDATPPPPEIGEALKKIDALLSSKGMADMDNAKLDAEMAGLSGNLQEVYSKAGTYAEAKADAVLKTPQGQGKTKEAVTKELTNSIQKTVGGCQEEVKDIQHDLKANAKLKNVDVRTLAAGRGSGLGMDAQVALLRSGLPPEALTNFGLDDSLVTGKRYLGGGAVNSVFEATWKTGTTGVEQKRVIKRDTPATRGVPKAGKLVQVADGYGASGRNLASAQVASKLGMGGILPKPDIVMHRGELALAMPKAEGKTGKALWNQMKADQNPALKKPAVKAKMAQELCKLEWLDCVTGQVDRHSENYLIHIDGDDVKLGAIDNDLCFGTEHSSPEKFDVMNTLRGPGAPKGTGGSVVADLSKMEAPQGTPPGSAVTPKEMRKKGYNLSRNTLGANVIGLPSLIDKSTYDILMGVERDKVDTLLGDSAKFLSPQAYDQAKQRLLVMRDHAEKLGKAGLVVDNWETWKLPKDIDSPTASITPPPLKVKAGVGALEYLEQCGGMSYYVRDFAEQDEYFGIR